MLGVWQTAGRGASQVALVVKNLPANAADIRDAVSIPRLGRSPGGGHGNPLQYSCLKNPMDRGAWWAIVHGITNSKKVLEGENNMRESILVTCGAGENGTSITKKVSKTKC